MKADNHNYMSRRITAVLPFVILTAIVIFQLDFMAQTQNEIPWKSAQFSHLNSLPVYQQKLEAEKQITVLKNSKDLLPFSSLDKKFVVLTVGKGYQDFTKTIGLFTDFTEINIDFYEELKQDKLKLIEHADHFILSIHISEIKT